MAEARGGSTVLASSGPSYLATDCTELMADISIVRSDNREKVSLWRANPGNWQPEEWTSLVEGSLGPWAMAVEGGVVVSICHTPVLTADVAEAGTWTRPTHRGRGLAAATTAVWASLLRPSRRECFYSTSTANRSSQAVTRRLGLPYLGTLWWLGPPV